MLKNIVYTNVQEKNCQDNLMFIFKKSYYQYPLYEQIKIVSSIQNF